jgi:hypothetical protein
VEWAPAWNPCDLTASSCRLTGLQEREALAQFLLPEEGYNPNLIQRRAPEYWGRLRRSTSL